MNLIIEQEKKGPIQIFQEIPKNLRKFVKQNALPQAIWGENFQALWQEFKGEGFAAWYNVYQMLAPVILTAKGEEEVLELRIALASIISGTWDKIRMTALPYHHFQMNYVPEICSRAVFDAPELYITFDVHFQLWWLKELGLNYKTLDIFIKSIEDSKLAELTTSPNRCSVKMIDHVYDILHMRYTEEGRKKALRDAVEGILFEALEVIARKEQKPMTIFASTRDKLYEVKAIIENDCPNYRGNDQLAAAVNLSAYQLYTGFKRLFNITPGDYHQEVRMAIGKYFLREGLNVNETALKLEYSAGSHFIEAFQKKFGYTPKQYQEGKCG